MSKEEAIEILSDIRCEYNLFGDTEEATRYHSLSWAIKAMSQPEIIRCRECKCWEYDAIFPDGWCRGRHQGNPDWYCADAERREE